MTGTALDQLRCDGCVLPVELGGVKAGIRHERFAPGTPVEPLKQQPCAVVRIGVDGYVDRYTLLDSGEFAAITASTHPPDRSAFGVVSA